MGQITHTQKIGHSPKVRQFIKLRPLNQRSLMKILVDNSVLHHALEHKGSWESKGTVMWGGKNGIPVETGRLISKENRNFIKETKGGPQGGYLASLALSYKRGEWEPHTSDAMKFENIHRKINRNYGDFSWFEELTYINHVTLDDFSIALSTGEKPINQFRAYLNSNVNQKYINIRSALESCGAKKSSQDAWHIHCVNSLGLDKFLTCDVKLIGQIKSIKDKHIRQKIENIVCLPSDLCKILMLGEATEPEREDLKAKFGFFI